jgi:hypothetical protein
VRREVRDHWQEMIDAERRPDVRSGPRNAVLSARKILLYATFGTAGIALAIPIVITAAVFTAGLLHEGVTTLQALLGR